MKENIKIGLLGIIALTLVINTFFIGSTPSRKYLKEKNTVIPQSNIAVTPASNNLLNPTPTNVTTPPPPQAPKLSEARAKTSMQFGEMSYNFGTIKQDSKNTQIFKFKNTGKEPLIIENAVGSCGCTVPTYPKEPVKPGEIGEIKVVYSPGKQQGQQHKTVTITANTNPITTTLNISANVEVPK